MPLNAKGKRILQRMKETYGDKKGERVFYASENKGTISQRVVDDSTRRESSTGVAHREGRRLKKKKMTLRGAEKMYKGVK